MRSLAPRWRESLAAALLVVLTVLAATLATAGGTALMDGPGLLLIAGTALAAGAWSPRAFASGAVVIGAGFMTIASQAADPGAYAVADDAVFSLVMLGCPALLGAIWAARRREARELTRLSTIRAVQVRAAVEAAGIRETNRIASKVQHDVVQTLGAIVVRAEGALGADSTRPQTTLNPSVTAGSVRTALEEIERAARTALEQLRAHIGTLRTADRPASAAAARTAGAPADPPDTAPGSSATPRPRRRSRAAEHLDRTPPTSAERSPRDHTDLLAVLSAVPICVEVAVTGVATGPGWAAVVAPVALAAPLAARRRHPLGATLVFVSLAAAISLSLAPLDGLVTPILPTLLMAYAVGAHVGSWVRVLVGLLIMVTGVVGIAASDGQEGDGSTVAMIVVVTIAVAAGVATARSASRVRSLDDLVRSIERHRDDEVRLVTERQRHTIARDLHDSVASAATIICLQASAAQLIPDLRQHELTEAIRAIADTARVAVREVRASLDVVDGPDPVGTADRTLEEVLSAARRAGVDAVLVGPAKVPVAAGETVTRIVRECLVNASRYAPGARVVVSLLVEQGTVSVHVEDDGAAHDITASPGTGTGLSGLHERLNACGGTFTHGPTTDGGYAVHARLPVPAASRSTGTATTRTPA